MYKAMIVDDEILVRIGLRSMINWESIGFEIVGEADNGEAAYEMFLKLQPEVLITDIKMPKKDGLWLTEKVKAEFPQTEIIILTAHDEFSYARKALQLNVADYILKAEMEEEEVREALLKKKAKIEKRRGENNIATREKGAEKEEQEVLLGLFLNEEKPIYKIKELLKTRNVEYEQKDFVFVQFDFSTGLGKKFSQKNHTQLLMACKQLIHNLLQEISQYCFIKQFGTSITCLLIAEELRQKKLKVQIENIRSSIRQYFDIEFKSSNSKIEPTIEKIRGNSEWMFNSCDELFFIKNGEHIVQKDETNKSIKARLVEVNGAELIKYIDKKDRESSIKYVEKLKNKCHEWGRQSLDLKLEIVQLINNIWGSEQVFLQGNEEDQTNFQKKVLKVDTLEELFAELKLYVEYILDCIKKETIDDQELIINKALKYVDNHYGEKMGVEDVAKEVGLSPYYFSSLFKKVRGIGFLTYLNEIRIERAKELLRNPRNSIAFVSERTGFNDQSYFSKIFKKYTGVTVTEYRATDQ